MFPFLANIWCCSKIFGNLYKTYFHLIVTYYFRPDVDLQEYFLMCVYLVVFLCDLMRCCLIGVKPRSSAIYIDMISHFKRGKLRPFQSQNIPESVQRYEDNQNIQSQKVSNTLRAWRGLTQALSVAEYNTIYLSKILFILFTVFGINHPIHNTILKKIMLIFQPNCRGFFLCNRVFLNLFIVLHVQGSMMYLLYHNCLYFENAAS